MKRTLLGFAALALIASGGVARAQGRPNRHAGLEAPTISPRLVRGAAASRQQTLVSAWDPWRGVPSFVWGASGAASPLPFGAAPSDVARAHLEAHAELYGLSAAALSTAVVEHVHDVGRGGIVVTFRQRVNGIEVFHDDAKVSMRRDGSLVAIGGHLHPDAVPASKRRSFALSRADAIVSALHDLHEVEIDAAELVELAHADESQYRRFELATPVTGPTSGLRFQRPARAKPVLFPLPERLVPAFYVEVFVQTKQGFSPDSFGYAISAEDGAVLYRRDMTSHAAFQYRVWAEAAGDKRPLDGPLADFTPHPTGVPDDSYPPYVAPALVSIDGFNAFADPWLPSGATLTLGNNVDAYTDHDQPGGFDPGDLRAATTSPGVFDRVYDTAAEPLASAEQSMAAVTQLFYVNNWLHDYWYDSGFDEASGNAQADNYGRGGEQGDPLHAEAQDKALLGVSGNANMMTPDDGESPRMQMYLWNGPTVMLDSTIDNLIVAHEWGHYIHHRLVFCAMTQCAGQSEGWGDFLALTMQLRPADDLDGAFSDAVYATGNYQNAAYFGLRRMPYSVDASKNPLSFRHIQDGEPLPNNVPISPGGNNAEVHNTGEIWASMMFEGFVALLEQSKGAAPKYSFDEARRRMSDYVVGGMKLAPAEPTFVEQRDGVLAAAFAADQADALLMAQGFATRGAGSCAVAPPNDTDDNVGVVESFVLAPDLALPGMTLDDSLKACDGDGLLDAGEIGEIVVDVSNRGLADAAGTKVTVSSTTPGVSFPAGDTFDVLALSPFTIEAVPFAVALDPNGSFPDGVEIRVTAEHATACLQQIELIRLFQVDYDDSPASSTSDSFESVTDVWTREGDQADVIWALEQTTGLEHAWHGVDYSAISDTALVSPPLAVAAAGNLVLSFSHRHSFETSPENPNDPNSPIQFWDGGVIEITTDGMVWNDVSQFGDPGYGGQIGNLAENPLLDRQAYVEENASWPARDSVTVDLGQGFAGQTVQVRFRIGTDQAAGGFGWEIDGVSFQGLAGTPFPSVVADATMCVLNPPVADAGPDQTAAPQSNVALDASGSSDPDGDTLAFAWSQVGGPSVALTGTGAGVTFKAPTVSEGTVLTFEVEVTAIDGQDTDTVDVVIGKTASTSASSTSSSGAGGSAGAGGSGEGASGGTDTKPKSDAPLVPVDAGCGCRTEPRRDGEASTLAAVALAIAAFARGRRRRR